jgi:hypothetical protein
MTYVACGAAARITSFMSFASQNNVPLEASGGGSGRASFAQSGAAVYLSTPGSAAFTLASSSYPAAVLADSPISYWRLDETSGVVAHDAQSRNNGTISGGVILGQLVLPRIVAHRCHLTARPVA